MRAMVWNYRRRVRSSAIALALIASNTTALAEPTASQPMAPSGKWIVAFEDDLCIAERSYGQGRDQVSIGFHPFPTLQDMEVVLIGRTHGSGAQRTGKGRITLMPGAIDIAVSYKSFGIDKGQSITHLYAQRDLLTQLGDASAMTIDADHRTWSFSLTSTKALIKTLHTCEVQLLAHWGVDPDIFFGASPPVPVEGNPAHWFGPDEYPVEAIRAREYGKVVALLAIDTAGQVSACRIVTSSKSHSLDEQTCRVARRIRYTPSHDVAGKPVATWSLLPVNWVLP